MNSLYNQLNQAITNDSIRSLMYSVKAAQNPQQAILQMANTNPRIASVLRDVEQNGGNARELFYRKAREIGVDPESILRQLR